MSSARRLFRLRAHGFQRRHVLAWGRLNWLVEDRCAAVAYALARNTGKGLRPFLIEAILYNWIAMILAIRLCLGFDCGKASKPVFFSGTSDNDSGLLCCFCQRRDHRLRDHFGAHVGATCRDLEIYKVFLSPF